MRSIYGLIATITFGLLIACTEVRGQFSKPDGDGGPALKPTTLKKAKPKTTVVEFELLQGSDGGGMHAQHWLKTLAPLDVAVRVHRPTAGEKPEIKEREVGTLRYVTAIGTLERSGRISFPDKSFAVGDSVKLKEWVEELRTYGAQGGTAGKPLWGLTKLQFTEVFDGMLKPVGFETHEQPLAQMTAKLPLPSQMSLRWSPEAKAVLTRRGDRTKLKVELKGLSAATALAVALNENGLGFRPNRTPSGEIELLIEPKLSNVEQWPIGWPLQIQRFKALPKFFAMVPIELTDPVELADVINAVSKLTDTMILVDYAELEAKKIDLDKIKVTYPPKKTNWDVALKSMVMSQKLAQEIWQDEAGNAFVWITSIRSARSNEPEKTKP